LRYRESLSLSLSLSLCAITFVRDDVLSTIDEKMFILENKTNKKYKINIFYSRDFQRKVYSLSLYLTEYYFYFQSSTLSDNTTILLDSLHATWHIVRCCRRCIRVMPEKFAKLFTTCVGGAHLRRKATRTPQVLRVIRVVHYRLRAHYSIKRSEYTIPTPSLLIPLSQTWCCSLLTE